MNNIKDQARLFFDERGIHLSNEPTLEELCYVSGRDPRLWTNQSLYDDMIQSINEQLGLTKELNLLEVGCAAGFLAKGLAKMVSRYTGVDIAAGVIKSAKKLKIANANFLTQDATQMKLANSSFDRTLSYDVFTNFPDFDFSKPIIDEMLRVTKSGGKTMIGSLADVSKKEEFLRKCKKVGQSLDTFSTQSVYTPPEEISLIEKIKRYYYKNIRKIEPAIVCYYANKKDFIEYGAVNGLDTQINDIHEQNPYFGYRFNVVYTKA